LFSGKKCTKNWAGVFFGGGREGSGKGATMPKTGPIWHPIPGGGSRI